MVKIENKKFEELSFTDDFMFCKVLENNKQICIELLELILDKPIKDVVYLHDQEEINITYDGKGIRLDVYLRDNDETVYDIEMQTTPNHNLARRSRYYQGMIDLRLIEKGADYKELNTSYIIFICLKNPFGLKRNIYTFQNVCLENTDLLLKDGTTKVFISPEGSDNDISPKLKQFLEYLVSRKPIDELSRKIDNEVKEVQKNEKWRTEYMTLQMRDRENIEKGIEQGIEQGIEKTRFEFLNQMLSKQMTEKEIMDFGFSQEEIDKARSMQ